MPQRRNILQEMDDLWQSWGNQVRAQQQAQPAPEPLPYQQDLLAVLSRQPVVRWDQLQVRRFDIISRAQDRAREAMVTLTEEDVASFGHGKTVCHMGKTPDWLERWR